MSTNTNNNKTKKTYTRSDRFKFYSVGAVIILIAIILLTNVLFDKILGRALTFDFSDSLGNSISQESIDFIDSLPADCKIRIVGLMSRPNADKIYDTEYQYIVPLLDDYVKNSSGRISVEYIDPTVQPTILSELDPSNSYSLSSYSGCFVVKYNDQILVVDPYDCYGYDETYISQGYFYVLSNNVEYKFTNTMYILTQGYSCKAYVITGLSEEGNTYLAKVLEGLTIEYNELPASENFVVPNDCDLIILNGPNQDIPEKVYVALSDYISKNGKLLVAVDCSMLNFSEKYERLNHLLNQMNVNIDPVLISENDPGYQLSGYQLDSVVKVANGFTDYADITLLHNTFARSVRNADVPGNEYLVLPVLLTSENASSAEIDVNGNAIESSIVEGRQFNVAMYTVLEGEDPSKAFVFGTLNFTSDEYMSAYGMNDSNVKFLRSCIRELMSTKQFTGLNIEVKNVDDFSLDTEKSTIAASTAVMVVFMIIIPILLEALAVVVYTKRKNL